MSHYDGPAKIGSVANAVTVSPEGSKVFVTGETWNAQRLPEYATVAYNASTGARLWASLHAGQAASGDPAAADSRAIVVSPDGKVVYVTGFSGHAGAGGRINSGTYDYVTIAMTPPPARRCGPPTTTTAATTRAAPSRSARAAMSST